MPCGRKEETLKDTLMPCGRKEETLKDTLMPCGRKEEKKVSGKSEKGFFFA